MKFYDIVRKTITILIFTYISAVSTITYAAEDQIQLRLNKQSQDIDKGITLGQLTPKERALLKKEHTRIKVTYNKILSDNKVDSTEKAKILKMLNKNSLKIFDLRYNKDRK